MLYTLTEAEFKVYRECRSCVVEMYNNLVAIYEKHPDKVTEQMKEKMKKYKRILSIESISYSPYSGI